MQISKEQFSEDERQRVEHHNTLMSIRAILATKPGVDFIKYLLKSFDITELPPRGLSNEFVQEELGYLRAGRSIYKIVSEANPEITGNILGMIEKEKHVQAYYDQKPRSD
jgi:hypothetical protein